VRFLVDACVGKLVTEWLRRQGHDAVLVAERGPDPGDEAILRWAVTEGRILVMADKDFGALIYRDRLRHGGVVRLPHASVAEWHMSLAAVIERYGESLVGAIVVVQGERIRLGPPAGPN
jgi:predicted nuclease of predicted toxin-antitoxin system